MVADIIHDLQTNLHHGGERAFDLVPMLLKKVIETRAWASREDKHGKRFASFEAFVTHEHWEGLESTIDDLRVFCRKHPEVERLVIENADQLPRQGRPRKADNISFSAGEHGTSSTYTLKRLKRDRPDIFQRVLDGTLSAHAAAIEAGFRRRTFSIPDDIEAAAAALARHFVVEELVAALREVKQQ